MLSARALLQWGFVRVYIGEAKGDGWVGRDDIGGRVGTGWEIMARGATSLGEGEASWAFFFLISFIDNTLVWEEHSVCFETRICRCSIRTLCLFGTRVGFVHTSFPIHLPCLLKTLCSNVLVHLKECSGFLENNPCFAMITPWSTQFPRQPASSPSVHLPCSLSLSAPAPSPLSFPL